MFSLDVSSTGGGGRSNDESLRAALSKFWPCSGQDCGRASPPPSTLAPSLLILASNFSKCFYDARPSNEHIRLRLTVTEGRQSEPCPLFHTDDVVLRCIVALAGPPTVVATKTRLAPRYLPSFVGFQPKDDDEDITSPPPGSALLLKGERWGLFSAAAAHKSPDLGGARRVLLVLDRLADV